MAERFKLLVLNAVSANGLKRLPADRYTTGKDIGAPVSVLGDGLHLRGTPCFFDVQSSLHGSLLVSSASLVLTL